MRHRQRGNSAIELETLLTSTIDAVVRSQEQLDRYTERRQRAYEQAEPGSLAVPPLWYVFDRVAVELELSARVDTVVSEHGAQPRLLSQTLNPTAVALYGHQAVAGLRVRLDLRPQGVVAIREPENEPAGPRPGSVEERDG